MKRFAYPGIAALILALLAALAMPNAASAAWPHSTLTPVSIANLAYGARAVPDGAGGAIIGYTVWSGASYDVRVQRVSAIGTLMWGPNGISICAVSGDQYLYEMVPDGFGGAILGWEDSRNAGTGVDLYVQRISNGGIPQWTTDGVRICDAVNTQNDMSMVADGNGGAFMAWTDNRNTGGTLQDIYAQYVYGGGTLAHGPSGVLICNASGLQQDPHVNFDSFGYPVMVWADFRSGSADIYVQRMVAGGSVQLAANGVAVCNAAGAQYTPFVVPGGYQGLVVGWTDSRSGTAAIYAQRLDIYTGAGQWAANGLPFCTAAGSRQLRSLVSDTQGGYVLTWDDSRNGVYNVYSQRIDLAGNASWTTDGLAVRVASGNAANIRVIPDGLGNVLYAWDDARAGAPDVYAQRLGPQGWPLWKANGVPVATSAGGQQQPDICATPTGGAVIPFVDTPPSSSYGVRVMGVDEWGYLGAEPVMAGVGDVPNDQGGRVRLAWYASPLDTDPLFRNISNYLIFRSVTAPLATTLDRVAPLQSGQPFTTLGGRRFVRLSSNSANYFWEEVGSVTARHLASYSFIAPTEGDSIAGSNPRTSFMVMALANYGSAWWVSASDSAYSVDNLAPAVPAPFTGQYGGGTVALHWDPNTEADLAGYRLYRGTSPGFATGPGTLVAALADTGYTDLAGQPYYYKLTAVDVHGNESPVAFLQPQGTLDAPGGAGALHAHFAAPRPNPLRAGGASLLRFAITQSGRVRLALHDAQGRTVRVMLEDEREAGEHTVAFDGRGADGRRLSPGLYLARLEAPGLSASQRVVVVE